ncbi:MAG TPA: DUF5134 domain-containing protein [Actinomycetes bacterium]|nr:DUF5134 domain-containing protein [Actinomycetes bacterium]
MTGPAWLTWPLVLVVFGTGAFHAGRLLAARRQPSARRTDVDVSHLVMSVAMAAVLLRPAAGGAAGWAVVVGLPAAWFAGRTADAALAGRVEALGHAARQLAVAVVMLFMLSVPSRPSPSVGLAGFGMVALLALVSAGLIREVAAAPAEYAGRWVLRPGPGLSCQLAMTSAMGAMLVLMAG